VGTGAVGLWSGPAKTLPSHTWLRNALADPCQFLFQLTASASLLPPRCCHCALPAPAHRAVGPKDDRIPSHDVLCQGRGIHPLWWVLLQPCGSRRARASTAHKAGGGKGVVG